MPLAEDQRAMLQLLLEGGQSYADIGSLLGVDAGEVRNRARAALQEMGGADPDAQVSLTDYLLGQADPIGRADAARHLQGDPAAASLAQRLSAQLRLLAPNARLPELPAAGASAPAQPAPSPAVPAPPPTGATTNPAPIPSSPIAQSLPAQPGAGSRVTGGARSAAGAIGSGLSGLGSKDRRLPVALGAAALLVIVVVILFVTGAVGGGDEGGDSSTTSTGAGGTAGDVTTVPLEPVNGSGAGGQATFTTAQQQPLVQLNLFGLDPSSSDSIYIVWFYNSDQQAVPFGYQQADKDGNVTGSVPIPQAVVSALPSVKELRVTKTSAAEAQTLEQAISGKKQIPYVGETVLKGDLPGSATASSQSGASTTPTTP
jgi:anti-sigma factor RsiW